MGETLSPMEKNKFDQGSDSPQEIEPNKVSFSTIPVGQRFKLADAEVVPDWVYEKIEPVPLHGERRKGEFFNAQMGTVKVYFELDQMVILVD